MARLLPFLYASLCLVVAGSAFAIFDGPGGDSSAKMPDTAAQTAMIPDNPDYPQASSETEAERPQAPMSQSKMDSKPAIPASGISLSREQQQAAQEMQIAPLSQEDNQTSAAETSPSTETPNTDGCKWEKSFLTTAYGPPWNSVEGGPQTATGKALKEGRYYVAVDPNVIPLGSQMRIWPNPHNYRGLFTAEDTGGAIKGNKIDIFVWQGKSVRDVWKKNAKVCLVRSGR